MARTKMAAAEVPVPQNDSEAREALRRIGELDREILAKKTRIENRIERLKKTLGDQTEAAQAEAKARRVGLQTYCEANRDRLTENGKRKSYRFTTGRVSWRTRPQSVKVPKGDAVAPFIAKLIEDGFSRFVRTTHSINKEAMLDDPTVAQQIDGVTIGSAGEDFIIEITEETVVEDEA